MEYWNRDDVVADLDVVEHRRSFAGPTVYRVILKVFAGNEFHVKINEVFVWRRYSEFKKLHSSLKTVCSQTNELDVFPDFSKGKIFGRFEEHIVKERQDSAANFLKYVARNPVLCKSHFVKNFFEGAVKVTRQASSLSEEPTYLLESHDRLSVSGETMDGDLHVDTGEEELEELPLSQARGTWNDRQPTPDPLEASSKQDNIQYVEEVEEGNGGLLSDSEICDDATIVAIQQNPLPNNGVTWSPVDVASGAADDGDSNDNDDGDVFGEFEAYKEDESQWLRKAFSVCSEGDDIQQLASEAADLLPVDATDASRDPAALVGVNRCISDDESALTGTYSSHSTHASNTSDLVNCEFGISCEINEIKRVTKTVDGADVVSDANTAVGVEPRIDKGVGSEDFIGDLCVLPTLPCPIQDENTNRESCFSINETSPSSTIENIPFEGLSSHDDCSDELQQAANDNLYRKSQNFDENLTKLDPRCDISYPHETSLNQRPTVNKDGNENHTISDAMSSDSRKACSNDEVDRNVSLHSTLQDSCDAENEDQFSISLDDKLKKRIQRAIESDDYIYQSSLAMSEAIELEDQQKFKASFKLYKLGIGLLLQGVKQDMDEQRREAVRRKTAQYLLRAENVYRLCCMLEDQKARARGRPIRLAECRTVGIVDKIILVERAATNEVFALKVLHKCGVEYKNRRKSNSKGGTKLVNSKYMVKLYHQTESSTGIQLFLEYISCGLLWNYLEMDLNWTAWSSMDVTNAHFSNTCTFADVSGPKLLMLPHSHERTETDSNNVPEDRIRSWIAEIVTVLGDLHKQGIICRDLNPRNILIDEHGHIKLTYFSNIRGIEYSIYKPAIVRSYAAPEARGVFPLTPAADWWSLGAILFELLTRKSLYSCYPNGIHSHSIINLPKPVSNEAWSLLAGLLRYNSEDRLGSGVAGCEEIKSHPFFASIDWSNL